jgi:hypothetical protein
MQDRFGISQAQAYNDIRELYEACAEQRKMSRVAEAAALLEKIDAEEERLRDDSCGELGRAPVTRALGILWDMRAKLTGAYRDTTRIVMIKAELQAISGATDDELERMLAEDRRALQLPPGVPIEAQGQEHPPDPPKRPEPVQPEPPAPRKRGRPKGRGNAR